MSPFQEFRYWLRTAPGSERAAAAVAAILAVVVLAWLLVPGDSSSKAVVAGPVGTVTGASAGGASAAGQAASGTATTVAGVDGAGATSGSGGAATAASGSAGASSVSGASASGGGGAAGAATATSGGCVSPPGSAPGVSASQIKIAVTLVNIVGPAANNLFGVPTPERQQAYFQAIIDSMNREGGIACRRVVPTFYPLNPANQDELEQKCRDIAASGVFAVIDPGAYAQYPQVDCYAQHHLPYFGGYFLFANHQSRGYPYLFNLNLLDTTYKDTIFALKDRGFFAAANGFQKLGFVYRDCEKPTIDSMLSWMHQAGLSDSQIVTYSVGCPSVFASPNDLAQAVLKFRQSGVTHVTTAYFLGDFANFTNIAEQQGWRPKYGLADDALISISYGSQAPNASNIANAIAIAASRGGEERTPGMAPTAGTVKCSNILEAKGLGSAWQEPANAGNACNQMWMFKAAVEHAPALRQDALAAGLQRTKSIDFSYPQGPNDFSGPRVTTGGQFWRVTQFMPACKCWQVVDREFHPGYG